MFRFQLNISNETKKWATRKISHTTDATMTSTISSYAPPSDPVIRFVYLDYSKNTWRDSEIEFQEENEIRREHFRRKHLNSITMICDKWHVERAIDFNLSALCIAVVLVLLLLLSLPLMNTHWRTCIFN